MARKKKCEHWVISLDGRGCQGCDLTVDISDKQTEEQKREEHNARALESMRNREEQSNEY